MASASAQAGKVARTLKKKGRAMLLEWRTAGTANETTGAFTPGSTLTKATSGVVSEINLFYVNGTSVLAGDKKAIIPAKGLGVTVRPGMVLYLGKTNSAPRYEILSADLIEKAGVNLVYELHLRGLAS